MTSDIVETDYGSVNLSKKMLNVLDSCDKNWREIYSNKKYRSKHAKFVRAKVRQVESAVNLMAEAEWIAGGELEEV